MSDHLSDLEKALGVVPEVPKLKGWDIIAAEQSDTLEEVFPTFSSSASGSSFFDEPVAEDEPTATEWIIDFSGGPFGIVIDDVWAATKEEALVKAQEKLTELDALEIISKYANIHGNIYFYPQYLTLDHIKEA